MFYLFNELKVYLYFSENEFYMDCIYFIRVNVDIFRKVLKYLIKYYEFLF